MINQPLINPPCTNSLAMYTSIIITMINSQKPDIWLPTAYTLIVSIAIMFYNFKSSAGLCLTIIFLDTCPIPLRLSTF